MLYASATEMLTSLRAARADDSYDRKLVRLITPELLIIDDLGLRPLTQDEPLDLYEIIRRRYEHTSTIITSNRDVEEWYPLFGNVLLASAAMDRLLHNAHTVVMDGDTYRNPPPAKRAKRGNNPDTGGPHRWMTNPIRLAALHRYPARAIPRDQPSTLPVNNRDPIGRRRHDPITRLLTLRSRNAE